VGAVRWFEQGAPTHMTAHAGLFEEGGKLLWQIKEDY
jgi:hypothetical protein